MVGGADAPLSAQAHGEHLAGRGHRGGAQPGALGTGRCGAVCWPWLTEARICAVAAVSCAQGGL